MGGSGGGVGDASRNLPPHSPSEITNLINQIAKDHVEQTDLGQVHVLQVVEHALDDGTVRQHFLWAHSFDDVLEDVQGSADFDGKPAANVRQQ